MKPFQLLIKPVSFDCNLRCEYCFYLRVCELYPSQSHPRMSENILEILISKFLSYRFPESIFGWQGGEPTLAGLDFFKKVVFLQQKYGISGQVIGNALQTNGVLIDPQWAQFLAEYRFLVGLSLDGPKEIHDRYRMTRGGKSVWSKVMHAAELFQRYGVAFNILCVVSRANVNRVDSLYTFFKQHGFNHLQLIPALEVDQEGKRAPFSVNPNQYAKFLLKFFSLWKQDEQRPSIRLFDALLNHYLGRPKGFCTLEESCADYFLIEWNGDVFPCDFFASKENFLGNIAEDDFSTLKQKRDTQFGLKKRDLPGVCHSCRWKELCFGGCVKDRVFSDNPHPDRTYYCRAYQKFFKNTHGFFKEMTDHMII